MKKIIFRILPVLALLALVLPAFPVAAAPPPPPAQTPLNPKSIPQFVDPLPSLHVITGAHSTDATQIELQATEFQSMVLPASMYAGLPAPYSAGTYVWGYLEPGQVGNPALIPSYIGPVVVATRNQPTQIKFVNNLGTTASTNVLAYKNSTDQSLHWANPNGAPMMVTNPFPPPAEVGNPNHYDGAIPMVPHLHGGEQPAAIDGGPDQWFTSSGDHGPAFYSGNVSTNDAVFRYPNVQQSAPLWFHDHTLGATRLNVYAGLAGAYVLQDPANDPTNLPPPVPLVVQDRMFDVNGQLYFPSIGINPEHPYWTPEFLGDVIVVNGKTWPFLNVEAKRYRLLFYNGSNARTYEMSFQISGKGKSPTFWQIGTDGGYMDAPAAVQKLVLMPGERAEVIVDFGGFTAGTNLILQNTAKAPYPAGAPPQGSTTGRIMQFRVTGPPAVADTSFNPTAAGATLRGGPGQGPAIVKLADPVNLTPAAGLTISNTRQLTLNEVMAPKRKVGGVQYPGGPLEVLVNNTKWSGLLPGTNTPIADSTPDGIGNYLTETPDEGTTEVWEFVNTTADAHPIHLHLVQFQVLSRQTFDVANYMLTYAGQFPGGGIDPLTGLPYPVGTYMPGYGPPNPYNTPNADVAVGGNPAVSGFLYGVAMPPAPNEMGWKDTVMAPPGMVTRIVVRWGTQDSLVTASATDASFSFIPNTNGYDFVWHCHIIDHEDNEMMRPDQVIPNPGAIRSYIMGTDY